MTMTEILHRHLEASRRAQGLLTPLDLIGLADRGILVHDPLSTLIGVDVQVGDGCIFYPGTQLLCHSGQRLMVGEGNVFYPGCWLSAEQGPITLGAGNRLGEGGFIAVTNRAGGQITLGSHGRYQRGAALYAEVSLGDGCQILGPIAVQDCRLAGGGDFTHPEPDERGAVLKGTGTARGLTLKTGEVIAGAGVFDPADLKPQSYYHPRPV